MTISYNWLKEYVDIPESPEELAHILTSTGLEVESVEIFETVKGSLQGLVIGEVLTCAKHPNADKLSITTVDVGDNKTLPIVCGAPNVEVGQKVIVALPGTTLYPSGGEPFTIKATKIRGERSEGMICAEDEIGLGKSHDGIIVLHTDLPNGTPASRHYKVESDHVIEIGLTPNRADAASHLGVARDVKAAKNRGLKLPDVSAFVVGNKNLSIAVEVENNEACPRYSAVTISGVSVSESPEWLKRRLTAIGQTPINCIVDITNFVCHELGQPLHAFDADKINGNKVIVKTLPQGTKFTTLDKKERSLNATDLMICDATGGMCLAGVFGGINSGITANTKNIFLESAYFSPEYVRRTSMHHQLKTDASFRFERGTDPNNTVYALKRAAVLIWEIAGGEISSDVIDVYPSKIGNRVFNVKYKNIDRLIGKKILHEQIHSILENLDIRTVSKNENDFEVSVPPYRVDVTQEADIAEEVLRIYGFNNIELSNNSSAEYLASFPAKDINSFKRTISELLVSNGFYEIWTNSLTNYAYQQKHNLSFRGNAVEMLNKLSEEQGILRQTMLFTGLEVASYNINRKQKDLKLFEFGKIYFEESGKHQEEERLTLYMSGNVEADNWRSPSKGVSYYDLAQHVHHILIKCGLPDVKREKMVDQLFDYGVRLIGGKKEFGKVGKVKQAFLKDFGVKQDLFYAELNTSLLFQNANPKLVIQEVAKFPEVRRDLSLVLDKQISFEEIHNLIMEEEKRLIKNIIAFDVYEGDKIPKGKKAYALGFTLQNVTKTLTDDEIDKTMERLMVALQEKLGALIRK
jgi:phenylalanyl-tRNA synthetase beta chain